MSALSSLLRRGDYGIAYAVSLVLAMAWTLWFAVRGVLQFLRFHHPAFDLGIFAQGTWLLSQGETPFVTARGLHLFADHSSYILAFVAPIYALIPTPATLIVLTVLAMALGAQITFCIARRAGAEPWLSALTATLVLLAPAVQWQVRDGFHPEVLVVPLVLGAVALLQRDRPLSAYLAILVALTAKEDVGLLVAPLGLAVAFFWNKPWIGGAWTATGLAAFALNFFVLLPLWSPTGELLYNSRYDYLGEGFAGIVVGLLTSPEVWFEVATDPKRIGYTTALLAAMPLCLLAPRWLLIGIPTWLANVLSLHAYQYEIKWHYTAYLIVTVAIAASLGAGKVQRLERVALRRALVAASLAIPIAIWIWAGPLHGWARPNDHHARIDALLAKVPEDAAVSAWTTFVPRLANRKTVYRFPNPFKEYYYGPVGAHPPNPLDVEWIALRKDSYKTFHPVMQELIDSGSFVEFYEDSPFVLLKRVSD